MAVEARYDAAADWYVGFTRDWAAEARPFLPRDPSGQHVLDMGCGLGELSRLIAGLGASVTAVDVSARVLAPGGWFSFSLLHPCFPGLRDGASEQLSSWPPGRGYASEGWWTTHGDGVRGRVGANHRMLATYLNATVRAGFVLEEFGESATEVPRFLIVRCRKGH